MTWQCRLLIDAIIKLGKATKSFLLVVRSQLFQNVGRQVDINMQIHVHVHVRLEHMIL